MELKNLQTEHHANKKPLLISRLKLVEMKYAPILLLLPFLFLACWPCKEPVVVELGAIPDSILALVPYQDGESYEFEHSGGSVIMFESTRSSYERYWKPCPSELCCDTIYLYNENQTSLRTNYPIFDFGMILANYPNSRTFYFSVSIGRSHFEIPLNRDYQVDYEYNDSLFLQDRWYPRVYSLKLDSYNNIQDAVYPDSLYYSLSAGILKIGMSNEEFYQIHE